MGLEKLYLEAKEISDTINEINTELKAPAIVGPCVHYTVDFFEKFSRNVEQAVYRKREVFAKEIGKMKKPQDIIVFGVPFLAFVAGGTVLEVAPEAIGDIAGNIAARKAAKGELDKYRKELAVKYSLIVEEQQRLIKEKAQIKNSAKEKQIELEERIEKLSKLIEKCNRLLREQ